MLDNNVWRTIANWEVNELKTAQEVYDSMKTSASQLVLVDYNGKVIAETHPPKVVNDTPKRLVSRELDTQDLFGG